MAANQDTPSSTASVFPGQRTGEELEFVLRAHPVTLLAPAASLLFALFLPWMFYTMVIPRTLAGFLYHPYQEIFFLLVTIYYGFLWIAAAIAWSDYYLDVLLVTNKRIMNVQQEGLFHRVVSELELERIQDITSFVDGPLQTFFSYGDLEIQTASEENKIRPRNIPHPVTVRRKIMELCTNMDESSSPVAPLPASEVQPAAPTKAPEEDIIPNELN